MEHRELDSVQPGEVSGSYSIQSALRVLAAGTSEKLNRKFKKDDGRGSPELKMHRLMAIKGYCRVAVLQ